MKKKLTLLLLFLLAGITAKADIVQINTQEDFDNWVAQMNDGTLPPDTEVELNSNVTASSTTGHIINEYNGVFNGNFNVITLDMHVTRPDGELGLGTAFVGSLNGTIRNVYFDGVVEGNSKFLGTVAKVVNATGQIENVHSTVTLISHISGDGSHGGIVGHTVGGLMKNIVFAGKLACPEGITNQCGGIIGWAEGGTSMENVLMIGDLAEIQDVGCNTIARNPYGVNGSNAFALTPKTDTPSYCQIVTPEEMAAGGICFLLNSNSFVNPVWFQNLEEGDPYPTFDSSRGIVYPTTDGYTSLLPGDTEKFGEFRTSLYDVATAFSESEDVTSYAALALVAEYTALIAGYETAEDMDAISAIYVAESAKKAEIEASIAAYKNYEAVIAEIKATLEARDDFSGDDRDFLEEDYMEGGLAPGENEMAPNGSFDYIMEYRHLTTEEVNAEAEYATELLRLAIANGFAAGTDITDMMVNASFADGFNGWEGTLFTDYQKSFREDSEMCAAEANGSDKYDMYQEIVVGNSGVYELKVGGAWRPFNEWYYNSLEYYPYIYLNGNINYIQSDIEDYIPKDIAEDGVNCNLNPTFGWWADLPFIGESGDTLGYVIQGMQGVCDALEAGRYDNRILINATAGDTLRIGICQPSSEFTPGGREWVGIGDIHLYYQGAMDEAGEAVDRVLENMLKRANNLLSIQIALDDNYKKFPNWSQALKDRVAASIEKAATATDVATKYEVIQELSTAFKEVIDCKKAYRNYFSKVENIYSAAYAAAEIDPSSTELVQMAENFRQEAMTAYENGTMTTEEADECAIAYTLGIMPDVDENGVYHITNTIQFATFSALANSTTTESNGQIYNVVLDADVSMNTGMIIKHFYGTFDGQGHTLTIDINSTEAGAAPIQSLRRGGTVKNLVVRGNVASTNKFAASVVAYTYENATIDRVQSYANVVGDIGGDSTHGGILGVTYTGTTYVTNSLFAGSISGDCHSNGGLVGWSETDTQIENCLMIANVTTDQTGCNTFGRAKITVKNCYFQTPYGEVPEGAIQVDDAQMADGSVTYGLNGGNTGEDVAWRQDLGNDIMPTLDPTHKIVYKTEEGTYTNELPDGIHNVTIDTKSRIYNINGIRVEKTKKGVYIIDGKKVVVK